MISQTLVSFVTLFFAKVSILLLYLRVFSVKKILRYLIWSVIILQAIGYASFVGVTVALEVECIALTALTKSLCVKNFILTYAQTSFSVFTDFYILLLPLKAVIGLQMSSRRKVGVLIVFITGLL